MNLGRLSDTERSQIEEVMRNASADKPMVGIFWYDVVKDELYITANLNFQSQFANGYDYKTDSTNRISGFLAPAYLTVGLGAQYTPTKWFSLNLAPASGRLTIVNDQTLADAGAFGVKRALRDPETGEILEHGSKFRMELGAQLIANVNYEIFKNVVFTSKLIVFYDYMQTREFNALDKKYNRLNIFNANIINNNNHRQHNTLYAEKTTSFNSTTSTS